MASLRPIVEIKGVSKTYGGSVTAISDVSIDIKEGEFIVLFGPSGVGKSTLLRCINGLVTPTQGDIVVNGESVVRARSEDLRRIRSSIGMIFQEFNLINRLSVIVNVICGQLGHLKPWQVLTYSFPKQAYDEAVRCLQRVGLTNSELYFRRADTLSGGQKQRAAIARSLMQRPKIILADEPVASLDVKMQAVILDLLRDLSKAEGITVIMTLHHLELAKKYATRIIGLRDAKVIFDGGPGGLSNEVVDQVFGTGPSDHE